MVEQQLSNLYGHSYVKHLRSGEYSLRDEIRLSYKLLVFELSPAYFRDEPGPKLGYSNICIVVDTLFLA